MKADLCGVGMRMFKAGETDDLGAIRVYVDGNDVTDSCKEAYAPELPLYEGQGWALVLRRDENGAVMFNRDTRDIEYDTVYGVTWWECA
jgi:hypothetical protein